MVVGLLWGNNLVAQQETLHVTGNYSNTPIIDFLADVESKYPVNFYYHQDWLEGIFISDSFSDKSLESVIKKTLRGSGVSLIIYEPTSYILVNKGMPIQGSSVGVIDRNALRALGSEIESQ